LKLEKGLIGGERKKREEGGRVRGGKERGEL